MSESFIDRRAHARHRVFKGGRLAFKGGNGIDCTVRNISSGGARIDLASPATLPERFTLLIRTDRFERRCRPVWTNNTRIGVAFD